MPNFRSEDKTDAEVLVDTVDSERAAFIKTYFHAEWPNRPVYHVMVNTSGGDEAVVQAILSFLPQSHQPARGQHERLHFRPQMN